MGEIEPEFLCGQSAGKRGVDIADHDYSIRAVGTAEPLIAYHRRSVCSAWLPLPAPRLATGSGKPKSRRKKPDMLAS
jgi:hypothetical protein